MKTKELQSILENKNITYSAKIMCNILSLNNRQSWYQRIQRNTALTDEELSKIESYYGMRLRPDLSSNTLQLDYYPNIFGSCGNGSMVFDESSEKMSITKEQISNYSNSGKYSIISARGSSMSPTICDEDLLILQHNLEKTIVDNTIYLFKYNDELFIKRLVKNIDQIICISENPRFEDRVIIPKNNNFEIIGKVVGLIRKKV